MARKHDGIQTRCSHRQTKLVIAMNSALICFGVATFGLSGAAVAQSNIVASTALQTYNISAGSLQTALILFVKQADVKVFTDPALLSGKTTQGLQGNYTVQDGLKHLLDDSGLQAVPQGKGYMVKKSQISKSNPEPTDSETTLPVISVSAKSSPSNTSTGYTITSTTTATKTNTPLLDTPQSISVVTQAMIKDQAIQSMADTVRYVPGMGISQGEGNRDALVFRGNRSTGDFFVSGIRDDVQYFRDIYNIERVEVLKGPNGMIFGRGGSGGVINRVIKEADWNQIRELTVQAGSFDTKRVALDVGQGVNDVAAVRLNTMYENSGSFRNGVDLKRYGINPTVTIMPSDNTKVVLNAEYFKDDRTADRGIPSFNGRPLKTNASTFFGDSDRSNANTELKAANALIEHKFNDEVMIRNRTRFAIQDKFYQNVYPNAVNAAGTTVAINAYSEATQRDNFFNQTDLLFSLNTGKVKHDLVVGLEVGRQETDSLRRTGFFNNTATSVTAPLTNPITTVPITFRTQASDGDNHSVTKQTALYLQDQIKLLPQLQAILGVRYDRIEVDFRKNNAAPALDINTKDNFFSPRVGLVYKPIETVSIYTSYSLSYVPRAGEQLTSLTVTNKALEPEKFKNVEVGAKWDIRPGLALTTALFQLDRTNVIIPDPNNAAISHLGGGQRNKGFELGLAGRVTSDWSVMGGYTYQDGVITNTLSSTAKEGAVLAELPKNTFSLWNRYDINPRWGVGLGVINRGAMYTSTDNTVRLPGFTRVDAAIYAKIDKNLRAQLNIENLLDRNYYASAHNNNNISPGSPLAARVSLIANF
ncbi:TonB-dependent siderophore receptor [Candidatus Nitrotoga arctica]|uniref:TonB-dependent siderophore receptor n=1 Tax=Candidatus Nitrotoga arctica TaxID=453162 RepID=UPI001EFB7073|nr:TonB-dependent siderophore receptor [Candidatus Nitrotoga arctica]